MAAPMPRPEIHHLSTISEEKQLSTTKLPEINSFFQGQTVEELECDDLNFTELSSVYHARNPSQDQEDIYEMK